MKFDNLSLQIKGKKLSYLMHMDYKKNGVCILSRIGKEGKLLNDTKNLILSSQESVKSHLIKNAMELEKKMKMKKYNFLEINANYFLISFEI